MSTVAALVEIDWNDDGAFTNESAYVVSVTGQARLQPPASFIASPRGQVDTCTIVLSNYNRHFDAVSGHYVGTGSQLQMPLRVSATVDAVTTRLFTGVISGVSFSSPTPAHPGTVTLECRSRDYVVLQNRTSTTRAQFAGWVDDPPTEEEIIAQWLGDAGLVDGTDYISQAYATAHSVTATLDPGLFAIRWAWMDEESTLEECWQMAAAAGGRLYCNASGQIVYENMQNWALDSGSTALTRASFVDLSLSYGDGELYDSVTVEAGGRYLTPSEVIWRPDDPVIVPANVNSADGTLALVARLNQPLYRLDSVDYSQVSSAGASLGTTVSHTATQYSQRVSLAFENTSTDHAGLLPDLTITGIVASGQRGEEVTLTSGDSYWSDRFSRNRAVRNNPYIQSTAQARAVCELLRDWHEAPRLEGSITGIADPTIGVGERIQITDAYLLSSATVFYVMAASWTLNQAGYNATLSILDASAIAPYQGASPGYFVIGTNELGAADPQRGRVFY